MAEQTQIESLLAGEPAYAPVEPEPALESVAEPEPLAEAVTEAARIAIRDLEDGQPVRGVYAVRGRELRRKKNGEPWLRMTVGDATGTAEAVCWDDAEVRYALCPSGTPVHVSGGEVFAPLHVLSAGMVPPAGKAVVLSVKAVLGGVASPPGAAPSVGAPGGPSIGFAAPPSSPQATSVRASPNAKLNERVGFIARSIALGSCESLRMSSQVTVTAK